MKYIALALIFLGCIGANVVLLAINKDANDLLWFVALIAVSAICIDKV